LVHAAVSRLRDLTAAVADRRHRQKPWNAHRSLPRSLLRFSYTTDPLYVLNGREEGYVPCYDEYPDQVAAGSQPKG
jgi:fatty-acyl-CoA synthase